MTALAPNECAKLVAILSRISSPFEGEKLAAALAADRFINARGLRWENVIGAHVATVQPPSTTPSSRVGWRVTITRCLAHHGSLRRWEVKFLTSLQSFNRLSPKQGTVLRGIAERVLGKEAA